MKTKYEISVDDFYHKNDIFQSSCMISYTLSRVSNNLWGVDTLAPSMDTLVQSVLIHFYYKIYICKAQLNLSGSIWPEHRWAAKAAILYTPLYTPCHGSPIFTCSLFRSHIGKLEYLSKAKHLFTNQITLKSSCSRICETKWKLPHHAVAPSVLKELIVTYAPYGDLMINFLFPVLVIK